MAAPSFRFIRHAPDLVLCALLLTACTSCTRNGDKVTLAAPFNPDAHIGEISAVWQRTGEERAFADASRLKQLEIRFQYRADARNLLGGKLFVRLGEFQLVDEGGMEIAKAKEEVECSLGAGETAGALAGEVWVPADRADQVSGFRLAHFAVPLNDLGKALYRQWRLEGQEQKAAEVDAEIARYAAAPPCVGR